MAIILYCRQVMPPASFNTERTYAMSDINNMNGSENNNDLLNEDPALSVQAEQQNSAEYHNSSDEAASQYAYVSEHAPKSKPAGSRHPILKGIAFVLCLAIVGVGSVQGYRIYKDHSGTNGFSEYNDDKDADRKSPPKETETESNQIASFSEKGEYKSLFELGSREDAKQLPDIVDDIMPSVVGVSAKFEYTTQYYDFFGWGEGSTSQERMEGQGTGIIISDDGYIVTNAHCIYDDSQHNAGEAIEVTIRFSDESDHSAKIISYDTDSDIAVLKVNESGLKPAVFGNSDELRVGEVVIAIGNPLSFNYFGSVTSGIVSALNRKITINDRTMHLLQTDAAINAGNSGGPLVNSCGQVIGINSAKMASSSVEGLGFAIPINQVKTIVDDLINYNYVTGRPQFGWSIIDISESDSRRYNMPMGAYVIDVQDGSAADKAGIQLRDIVIEVDGEKVSSTADINALMSNYKAGDTVTLTINRKGEDVKVDVTLDEAKSNKSNTDNDRKIS